MQFLEHFGRSVDEKAHKYARQRIVAYDKSTKWHGMYEYNNSFLLLDEYTSVAGFLAANNLFCKFTLKCRNHRSRRVVVPAHRLNFPTALAMHALRQSCEQADGEQLISPCREQLEHSTQKKTTSEASHIKSTSMFLLIHDVAHDAWFCHYLRHTVSTTLS